MKLYDNIFVGSHPWNSSQVRKPINKGESLIREGPNLSAKNSSANQSSVFKKLEEISKKLSRFWII